MCLSCLYFYTNDEDIFYRCGKKILQKRLGNCCHPFSWLYAAIDLNKLVSIVEYDYDSKYQCLLREAY